MTPDLARIFDGDKYMWDGESYDTRKAAEAKQKEYRKANFETQIVEADGKPLLYTRRVVTEVVVDDGGSA